MSTATVSPRPARTAFVFSGGTSLGAMQAGMLVSAGPSSADRRREPVPAWGVA